MHRILTANYKKNYFCIFTAKNTPCQRLTGLSWSDTHYNPRNNLTQILIFLAVLNLEMLIRELLAFRNSMRLGIIGDPAIKKK